MSISGDRRRAGEIQQLVGRPGRRSNGGRLGLQAWTSVPKPEPCARESWSGCIGLEIHRTR